MDNSKSRKSDAAATRKRRSSILKSQRAPRAPFSELEFNVATPQAESKSRRVSFSRRTGVVEFEINEATTAFKNVYEEHNKSLETSGNESGGARPRRVQHLGGRTATLFQDAEAELVGDEMVVQPPGASLDFSPLTELRTTDVFRLTVDADRPLTDRLDLDFSAVAPLDDLDMLQRDLDADPTRRGEMSEYNIDVDFNATHFTLKGDDSDDMSITDSVHSPRVAAAEEKIMPDWTADKENIVVNPYVAPPPADFTGDDILVFDGKKCKFQSNLTDDELVKPSNASQRRTMVHDTATQAAAERVTLPVDKSLSFGVSDARASKTVFFDDVADMTVTQAVPAQILPQQADIRLAGDDICKETRRQTIVYGNEDADISVTQALPAKIIAPIQIACDDSNVVPERSESKTAKQKTIYFDAMADISITQTLPPNIIQHEPERSEDMAVNQTASSLGQRVTRATLTADEVAQHTDRRRTIVYGNDDGDLSVTGALPPNILDKEAKPNQTNTGRRTTIVYGNDNCDISITGVVPVSIIDKKESLAQSENARRRTIVYGRDDGNISMTGVVPANIMVDRDEAKLAQSSSTDRRKTIVYGNDDGNISMTGVVPANIMVNKDEEKPVQSANTELRRSVLYRNEEGNVSMNILVPANVIVNQVEANPTQAAGTDRRRTIVYGNDDGNISLTGVIPGNLVVDKELLPQTSSIDRRKTIVYGNEDGDVSVTGVVPANIMVDKDDVNLVPPTTERRRTVVFGNEDGNLSVTGIVPTNIIDKQISEPIVYTTTERRKTVVFGDEDGNLSVTGIVPTNIIDKQISEPIVYTTTERRKTVVFGNEDGNLSVTGIVPTNIIDKQISEPIVYTTTERRKTVVFGDEDGNLSVTGIVPTNIIDKVISEPIVHTTTERRKTVVFGDDDGNVSMTGVVPADIILDEGMKFTEETNTTDRRKTIVYGNDDGNISVTGVVPAHIIVDKQTILESSSNERRKTIVYGNDDGEISITGVVPADIMMHKDEANPTQTADPERRRTIISGSNDTSPSLLLSPTGVVAAPIVEVVLAGTERRRTVVYGNEDGDVSMTGVVPADIIVDDKINKSQRSNAECGKTGLNDSHISVEGVLQATDFPGDKEETADLAQPTTERRKTIVYGNEDDNLSMTGVVPANATMDKSGFNKTQPIHIERRETIVYGNDQSNLSIAGVVAVSSTLDTGGANLTQPILTEGKALVDKNDSGDISPIDIDRRKTIDSIYSISTIVVPADIVEVAEGGTNTDDGKTGEIEDDDEKENVDAIEVITETFDYREEEGDVSMTEVEPHSSVCGMQTQPTELEDMREDKSDQVSMTPTSQSPSEKSRDEISMQTSPVSRRSMANNLTYGELSYSKTNMSTFQKSPGKVVVYEASTRAGEIGQRQDEDGGSLSTYGSNDAQKSPVYSPEFDALSLTSNRASKSDARNKSDNFEAMCNSALDSFSRSLFAKTTSPADARSELKPDNTTLEVSRTKPIRSSPLGPGQMAFDVLSRSIAPDRALILEALSPKAVLERAALSQRSPPVSVLDALLDMSAMDDEVVAAPSEGPSRADSAATVAPARDHSRVTVKDSDDEAIDVDDDRETSDSTTPEHGIGDRLRHLEYKDRAVECKSPEEDARYETEDVERDEENQTAWPTNSAGTQADDTRAILDALDRFTETEPAPRRSLAPDRRSMVRSREDLLKDISMAQALMKTEMEHGDSSELDEPEPEPEASPPRVSRVSGDVVKTLRFEDDSIRESPGVLQKPIPAPVESRRPSVIPSYLQRVGELKDLMEDLVKPMADESPWRRSPKRNSEIQTDQLPSSQIDLTTSYRASGPIGRMSPTRSESPDGESEKQCLRTLSPLARLPAEDEVLVFDRNNPLNNVALPAVEGVPHKYAPALERGVWARGAACPALEPRAAQTDAPPPRLLRERTRRRSASPTERQSRASGRSDSPDSSPARTADLAHSHTHSQATHVFAAHATHATHAAHATHSALKQERASSASSTTTPMEDDRPVVKHRSPQRVAFKLASPAGSGAEPAEPAEWGAEPGAARKRGYSPAHPRPDCDVTPKPAVKVQKTSTASKVCRSASPSLRASLRRASPDTSSGSSDVTVQQLLSEFHLTDSTGSRASSVMAVRPAERGERYDRGERDERGSRGDSALHSSHSADDLRHCAGVDVINRIAVLPFMGTECSWESRSGDVWSFRLLLGRLRLVVRLAHRVQRARADTPVVLACVQHAAPHDSSDPVAAWCVRLAAEALQALAADTACAGAVPAALRRAVALCRAARRWARAMHHARVQLALALDQAGTLALKVANIPLRSVWEVTMRVELAAPAPGCDAAPWPRAADVRVAPVVASWAPRARDVERLLAPLPQDWGHVPRAVWQIFKYLKHKRVDDELLGA